MNCSIALLSQTHSSNANISLIWLRSKIIILSFMFCLSFFFFYRSVWSGKWFWRQCKRYFTYLCLQCAELFITLPSTLGSVYYLIVIISTFEVTREVMYLWQTCIWMWLLGRHHCNGVWRKCCGLHLNQPRKTSQLLFFLLFFPWYSCHESDRDFLASWVPDTPCRAELSPYVHSNFSMTLNCL